MSKLQITLNSVRDGSILKECPGIVKEILNGDYAILNVILDLGECLTHTDPAYRGGGILLIANILKLLPKTFLKSKELIELSTFISERLKDQNVIVSAVLEAVLALIVMENLPGSCATLFFNHMFENIPCQQQVIKDRLTYVSIIRESVLKYPEDMKALDAELMVHFIEAVDGERDPKCLVLNYRTFAELSKVLPNIEVTEDTFEVFAVYFPIDFSAPVDPDRPYTRDNLARLLKSCLLAYRGFSKYLLPLVLEKLDSQFEVAKIDSLEMLLESCDTYEDEDYKPFLVEISKLLRLEILTGSDSKTCGLSLRVLKRLAEILTESQKDLIEIVLNFCLSFMKDGSMQHQYTTIVNVLYMTSISSKTACEIILERILPVILQTPLNINSITALNILLSSYKTMNAKLSDELIVDIIKKLSQPMEAPEITSLAMTSLSLISTSTDSDTRNMVYKNSLKIISTDISLAEHYILHLIEMARVCTEDFKTIFIPSLMENLSTDISSQRRIEILIRLSFIEDITDFCFDKLMVVIKNPETFTISLQKLLEVLKLNKANSFTNMVVVVKLINKYNILEEIESTLMNDYIKSDDNTLNVVSQIFSMLQTYLSFETLSKQINKNRCKPWSNKKLGVYSGLVCNLPKTCSIPYVDELCACILESALSDLTQERFNANITMFKIINRTCEDHNMDKILNDLWNKLQPLFKDCKLWKYTVDTWAWIVKALLLRGNQIYITWLEEIFKTEPVFGDVLDPLYRILCFDCPVYDGNTQLLHKQRLFNITQSLLKEKPSTNTSLLVYNLLINYMPASILNMHSSDLSTILAETMRTSYEKDLLWICLYNIKKILDMNSDNSISNTLYENIDKFLPKLLEIAVQSHEQDQRRLSLIIINLYGNSKKFLTKFMRYKQDVLVCLKKSLNDPNRDIRFIVQESMYIWLNIDNEK